MVNVAGVVTPRPVLLVTTVDIGDGKSDTIEYRKGDDAAEVARLFVAKHGLPPAITLPLAQHILDNLKQALKVKVRQQAAGKEKGWPSWVGVVGWWELRRGDCLTCSPTWYSSRGLFCREFWNEYWQWAPSGSTS
jgi:hypothetical protein